MLRRLMSSVVFALVATVFMVESTGVSAQWLKYPTVGVPRTADGKPNLAAPTPRTADGKPDFSGMWLTGDGLPCPQNAGADFLECGIELPISLYGINMGAKMQGGLPFQPWAAALVKKPPIVLCAG